MNSLPSTSECLTPPQRTTPSPPPAEQPTDGTAWLGAHPGVSDPDQGVATIELALQQTKMIAEQ